MKPPAYRQALIDYIRAQAKPPDKFSHQPRLYNLAKRLAGDQPYDDDIVFAGAWLHDLGVFVGHRPEEIEALAKWDHIAYANSKAPKLLEQFGFPKEKIPAVLEVIRTHLPSSKPTSFEGSLLRDADILEQLGAIGTLRMVSKVGRDTRYIVLGDPVKTLRRSLEQLPGLIELPQTRKLAEPKIKLLRAFVEAAESEADGIDL
jgi:uncharacterized protein